MWLPDKNVKINAEQISDEDFQNLVNFFDLLIKVDRRREGKKDLDR